MPNLPGTWGLVVTVFLLFFGGSGGIAWYLRKEIRETRAAPAQLEQTKLQNDKLAQEIASDLIDSTRAAMAEMRTIADEANQRSTQAKSELAEVRLQMTELQTENARLVADHHTLREQQARDRTLWALFRGRVEHLLAEHGIGIPEWWHDTATVEPKP